MEKIEEPFNIQVLNSGDKWFFFSRKTNELIIEIEFYPNSFLWSAFEPVIKDEKLYYSLGMEGEGFLSYDKGVEMIEILSNRKELICLVEFLFS